MMVCLPSCNIDRSIYIWQIESKLWQFCKRIPAPLSFILISHNLIAEQLKRKSLEQSSMVPVAGAVHPHAFAQSDHQSPPRPTPHLISHLSRDIIFLMKFSRYHFSDKILEISLVFTHGITPAWVNHNRYFVKKCILMFRAMHGHLASPWKQHMAKFHGERGILICWEGLFGSCPG